MYGIYEAEGFPHESMWLSCFSMSANVPGDCAAPPRHPVGYRKNWIRLAGSREGRTFYYLGNRGEFILNGPDDQWDAHYLRLGSVIPGGPLVKGDELWFYYGGTYGGTPGCPGLTVAKDKWQSSLGIGIMRRDGFASLNAGEKPGDLITGPMVFEGSGKLFANADVKNGGYVKVAVLDEEGIVVGGFAATECTGIESNKVAGTIAWKGSASLGALKGRYVGLEFQLKDAKLYSFWIE